MREIAVISIYLLSILESKKTKELSLSLGLTEFAVLGDSDLSQPLHPAHAPNMPQRAYSGDALQ